MTGNPTDREIHLVGSVPLASTEEVFRAASAALGGRLKKLPDGETGTRRNWINFQYAVLASSPQLKPDGAPFDPEAFIREANGEGSDYTFSRLHIDRDVPGEIVLGRLGYADNALRSYALFARLKAEGVIGPDVRFQVCLPTPLAPIALFVEGRDMFEVFPVYRNALLAELAEIVAKIPANELAVQWDVAVEIGLFEGLFPRPPGDWRGLLFGQFAALGDAVPDGVALGYHLCYGDRGHKHFVEPKDTALLVEVASGILAGVKRPIQWIHLPVPRDRHDDAYFAPLAGLRLPPETRLFLGLVHLTDGLEGARRRIAAAGKVVADFGIGTECGLGRRDPATIPSLLALHAAIA